MRLFGWFDKKEDEITEKVQSGIGNDMSPTDEIRYLMSKLSKESQKKVLIRAVPVIVKKLNFFIEKGTCTKEEAYDIVSEYVDGLE